MDGADQTPHPPCKHCGGPVEPPKRRGLVKDFCRDRCRAAYRDARLAAAVQAAEDAVEEVTADLERGLARLEGAVLLLRKVTGPAKKRRENKVVDTVSIPDQ